MLVNQTFVLIVEVHVLLKAILHMNFLDSHNWTGTKR